MFKRWAKPLYTEQDYNENLSPFIQYGLARSFINSSANPVIDYHQSFNGNVASPMTRITPMSNPIKTLPSALSIRFGSASE